MKNFHHQLYPRLRIFFFIVPIIFVILIFLRSYAIPTKDLLHAKFFPSATPTTTPSLTPSPSPSSTPSMTPSPTKLPTPTPSPTPTLVDGATLLQYVNEAAALFSIDRDLLLKIGNCESGMNSNAKYLDYVGIYQFDSRTWKSTRQRMNRNPDVNLRSNPKESIETAAFKISTQGSGAWPNCR